MGEDKELQVIEVEDKQRKKLEKMWEVSAERADEIREKKIETWKRKGAMKEMANLLLNIPLRSEYEINEIKERFPDIPVNEMNLSLSLLIKQIDRALEGDSKAFEVIRDTSGQKPIDEQKIEMETKNVVIDILPEFENE